MLLPLVAMVAFWSCRAQKPNRPPFIKRTYHNITARYNGYFNAREIFRENHDRFTVQYVNSYDMLLPAVKLPGKEQAGAMKTDMETVIKKASKVIDRHQISRWVDDSYLLIGKAYFYQHDFYNALQSLQYVYNEYENAQIKQEALAWIGLSYMMQGNREDAETAFDIALSNVGSAEKVAPFVYASAAQYYIERANFIKAIELLNLAYISAGSKEKKVHFAYLLAQLYRETGQPDSAISFFDQVIALNPPYDIVFNATINTALIYNISSDQQTDMEAELVKMTEDEQNKEYLDRLYFVLGDIAQRKGDQQKAIAYFERSIRVSTQNENQKGISYLRLADIHLKSNDFAQAGLYYDSTITFLSDSYPNHDLILERSQQLKAIASNMQTISREDSLQNLASLPQAERLAKVEVKTTEILADLAEQKAAATDAYSNYGTNRNYNRARATSNFGNNNAWYFYNTSALSQGFTDFLNRWGNRPNEDNWRRGVKQSQELAQGEDDELPFLAGKLSDDKANPESIKEMLLAQIPLTPAQTDSSNARILKAYYSIASIYESDLNKKEEAIKYYTELLERFPESTYSAASYYGLYRLHKGEQPQESDKYKALLLEQYPNSEYAQSITNPNSILASRDETQNRLSEEYAAIYRNFKDDLYKQAIHAIDSVSWQGGSPAFQSKVAYLNALAIGYTRAVDTFLTSLKAVSKAFPTELLGIRASQMVEYIADHYELYQNRSTALIKGGSILTDFEKVEQYTAQLARAEAAELARKLAEAEESSYFKRPEQDAKFLAVIAVNDMNQSLKSTRFGLGQLNRRFYADKNYKIQLSISNKRVQLLSIGDFGSKEEAADYYNKLLKYRNNLIQSPVEKTDIFYITNDNFYRLENYDRIREYRRYFRVNFLSGVGAALMQPDPIPLSETKVIPPAADTLFESKPVADSITISTVNLPKDTTSNNINTITKVAEQYVLVVAVNNMTMRLNSTRLGISLFNKGYYSTRGYQHNSTIVNNETQLISVSKFSSLEEVKAYYKKFMSKRTQIIKAPAGDVSIFYITSDNFADITSQQAVVEYVTDFEKNTNE